MKKLKRAFRYYQLKDRIDRIKVYGDIDTKRRALSNNVRLLVKSYGDKIKIDYLTDTSFNFTVLSSDHHEIGIHLDSLIYLSNELGLRVAVCWSNFGGIDEYTYMSSEVYPIIRIKPIYEDVTPDEYNVAFNQYLEGMHRYDR